MPFVFHNFRNYDLRLIFQEIGKYDFKINVISKTMEKYMNFTIKQPKKKGIIAALALPYADSIHF